VKTAIPISIHITTGLKPGLEEEHAGRLSVCRPGAAGVPAPTFQS
jgi:hypothetical protein